MKTVVVVPGIMGTELFLGDEKVWPPKPQETLFGYKRVGKLRSADLKIGQIIDDILCYTFYSGVLDPLRELGFVERGGEKRLVRFPYDWRLDLFDTADRLAERLGEVAAAGADEIHLVAHSMGGLVCRLVLESPKYRDRPWFGRIRSFVAIAVPHLGAPLTLARVMGLDGAVGISGPEFAEMSRDPRYPSGYQLLPAPGELAVWDLDSPDVEPIDIYDDAVAAKLGLDPALVARTRALHDVLSPGNKPAGVRYVHFGATGHETVTRVNVPLGRRAKADLAGAVITKTRNAGDGTVPLYSALPRPGQRQIVENEHATAFVGRPFRLVFFRLLGGDAGQAIEAATAAVPGPHLRLTTDSPVQTAGRPMEIAIAAVDPDADAAPVLPEQIEGRFVFDRATEAGRLDAEAVFEVPLVYRGPPLARLTLMLPTPADPGLYKVSLVVEGALVGNDVAVALKAAGT